EPLSRSRFHDIRGIPGRNGFIRQQNILEYGLFRSLKFRSEIRPNRKSNPADLVTSCARLAKNLFAVSWIARGSQGGSKSFRHPFTSFWFSRDEFQRALANGSLVTLQKSQA